MTFIILDSYNASTVQYRYILEGKLKVTVMRILLVEDDPQLGDGISVGLHHAGYTVDWLSDGAKAKQALSVEPFDLVILDLGLPNIDGLSLLRQMRHNHDLTPVLILTARDTISDRVTGLDSGADDYLVKPFDLDEMYARIRAVMRRKAGRASPLIKHGDVELDPAAHTVTLKGKIINLSSKEYTVLHMLLDSVGHVLSKTQIEDKLYGWNDAIESNATEVHIHHLRKKIGKKLISTIRGVGYMIPREE